MVKRKVSVLQHHICDADGELDRLQKLLRLTVNGNNDNNRMEEIFMDAAEIMAAAPYAIGAGDQLAPLEVANGEVAE